jgi:membrane protein
MIGIVKLVSAACIKFVKGDGWPIASHVALSALTSIFPFLIFVEALAGFFGTSEIADTAAELLFEAWPPAIATPISAEVHRVLTTPRGGLLTMGALLSLYFSSNGVEALRVGLSRLYEVQDSRNWFVRRLEAILYVMIAALALFAFTFLMVFSPLLWLHLREAAPQIVDQLEKFYAPVRFGVASAVILLVLVVTHKYLPAGRRTLAMIAPGIFVTMVAWLGFGAAFGAYLADFAHKYVSTYAGLASIMIALVFLNWLAVMLLFGAALNQTIAQSKSAEANNSPAGLK